MRTIGLGQNLTQEKWNFSLVLMETIVDTLLKVASSKIKLIQMGSFAHWRNSKYDCRLAYWLQLKNKVLILARLYAYLTRRAMRKALSHWNGLLIMFRIQQSFESDLEDLKNKYKTKLMLMS
jgi:hypothetical protein